MAVPWKMDEAGVRPYFDQTPLLQEFPAVDDKAPAGSVELLFNVLLAVQNGLFFFRDLLKLC